MKKLLLGMLFAGIAMFSYAQQDLPAGMTATEKQQIKSYLQKFYDQKGQSVPPSAPVRHMGEWEEIEALTITWSGYHHILAQIVKYAQMECKVIINCTDSNTVKTYLNNAGVTPTNVDYIITNFNSIWIRDYGAQSVYKNDVDSLYLVDWVYNRPRPLDDVIPEKLETHTSLPLYQTDAAPYTLVNTGGNFMSDGLGTAFASNLVLDENPGLSNAEVDTIMKKFMGIDRYIKMTNLPYDGIHHIDMHMKLLDEETIIVGEYPQGVADGPQIEANINYIQNNFLNAFGEPYNIVRIPMPPDINGQYPHQWGDYTTYTNSVFVNKTLLVPIYYDQYDTTALRIYRENLPGYKVVGITCNDIIQLSGAIHCITNSVGSRDPLWISHKQMGDLIVVKSANEVKATIKHRSGISSATLYYRYDSTQAFQAVPMTQSLGTDEWKAMMPLPTVSFAEGQYYIQGTANSGKVQTKPMTAPQGYYSFYYSGGIDELSSAGGLQIESVYPNPARNYAKLLFKLKQSQRVKISLYDLNGKLIKDYYNRNTTAGQHSLDLDLSQLSTGLYMIQLQSDRQLMKQKILKQ